MMGRSHEGTSARRDWERGAEPSATVVTVLTTTRDAWGRIIVYAGTALGLLQSTDNGRTWMAPRGEATRFLVTSIAPSSRFASDNTLVIGTSEGCSRSNDGGATWQLMLHGGQVFAVAVVPARAQSREQTEPEPLVVFAGTAEDGVYRSDDSGAQWHPVNAGLLDLTILDFAFSPDFGVDGTGFAATASGLYRTRNGGKAWRELELPLDEPAVQCLAISPNFTEDDLVLAGTEDNGLFRSDDAGETWERVDAIANLSVTAVSLSPDAQVIAAGTDMGVAITLDQGVTWRHTAAHLGPVLCLTVVQQDGHVDFVAGLVNGGISRSENEGNDWTVV